MALLFNCILSAALKGELAVALLGELGAEVYLLSHVSSPSGGPQSWR
jgi:hypothetical protein